MKIYHKLCALIFAIATLNACTKESTGPDINEEPKEVVDPMEQSNGWKLVGTKSMIDMQLSPSQTFFYLKHIQEHGNVADVFFTSINAITTNYITHRWQVNISTDKEVYYKPIYGVYSGDSYNPNISFRSISLAEEDYDYVRKDGYFKGMTKIDAFHTENYGSFTNQFPIDFAILGNTPIFGNNLLAKIPSNNRFFKLYPSTAGYWATRRAAHIEHQGKLILITLDNDANNAIRVFESSDSIEQVGNGNNRYDEYAMLLKNEVQNLLFSEPKIFQGISNSYVTKSGSNYHISLLLKEDPTTDNYFISNFLLNPETHALSLVNYSYPNLNELSGMLYQMQERPGHFIKVCAPSQIDQFLQIQYFDGVQKNDIVMPQFKSFVSNTYAPDKIAYCNGKVYMFVTYKDHFCLLSKEI